MLTKQLDVNIRYWHRSEAMLIYWNNTGSSIAQLIGPLSLCGIIFLTLTASFSLHGLSARKPAAPSSNSPPRCATLRTDQPGAQGIDPADGFSRSFLVRLLDLAVDGRRDSLSKPQITRADSTAKSANAAHIVRPFGKEAGVSKVHFSGSLRLTFIDRRAPRSPANSDATGVFTSAAPSAGPPA